MMKWCHDQPDCAAVDVTEGVSSDLLIGWVDIRTRRAAYAAQRIFKTRIGPHLATPIIDEHNMHLFIRRGRSRNKRCIACNMLSGCASCEQAELRHSLCKCPDQLIVACHHDMHRW